MLEPPTLDQLMARVVQQGECLIWTGARNRSGYGNVGRSHNYNETSKTWTVHRLVYELVVGPIPAGHDLHHRCENRLCVSPAHLEPVTRREHHGKGGRHPEHMRAAYTARSNWKGASA